MSGLLGHIGLLLRQAVLAWNTIISWAQAGTSTGWANFTVRFRVSESLFGASTSVRLTFSARTSGGNGVNIAKAYVGQRASGGNGWDFSATPTPITFAGSSTATIPVGGNVVSDAIPVSLSGTADLIVSVYFPSTPATDLPSANPGNFLSYFKSGDDAVVVAPSGYTPQSGNPALLMTKVEMQ